MNKIKRPVVLVIRDGWGENHDSSLDKYNAIKQAHIPFSRSLSLNWPRTEIEACGLSVGLPEGIMGNSEVGHQNIGAGRIVDQEIVRIEMALRPINIPKTTIKFIIKARCAGTCAPEINR